MRIGDWGIVETPMDDTNEHHEPGEFLVPELRIGSLVFVTTGAGDRSGQIDDERTGSYRVRLHRGGRAWFAAEQVRVRTDVVYRDTLHVRVALSAIIGFMVVMGVVLCWDRYAAYRARVALEHWPEVHIELESVEVRLGGDPGTPVFNVVPMYSYSWKAVRRQGSGLWPYYPGHHDLARAEAMAASLRRDVSLTAHVDPTAPSVSFLQSGPISTAGVTVFTSVLVIGAILQLSAWLWPMSLGAKPPRKPSRERGPQASWAANALVFCLIIAFPVLAIAGSGYAAFRGLSSATFGHLWTGGHVRIPCTVTSVRTVDTPEGGETRRIAFQYELPGEELVQSNRIGLYRELSAGVFSLKRGDRVTCYYPTGSPREGFLVPEERRWDWTMGFGGIGLMAFLIWLMFATVQATQEAQQAGTES